MAGKKSKDAVIRLVEGTPATKATIEALWKEAEEVKTPEELAAFVTKLSKRYHHDYGTVVVAVAMAAYAGAMCMNRVNQGGSITGFQAGFVFWEFLGRWQPNNGPRRLVDYDQLLYPQQVVAFTEIPNEVMEWLKKRAGEELKKQEKEKTAHPTVLAHWKKLVKGIVPAGLHLQD